MSKRETSNEIYLEKHIYFQKIENAIAAHLGLSELKSGIQTIRNEKGWRDNEIEIEYIWIVNIARSFVGWRNLFRIKFKENKFREYSNPQKLVHGFFIANPNKNDDFFTVNSIDTSDDIINSFSFNLFEVNNSVALDGITYEIRIIAPNIDTYMNVKNPITEEWKKWESKIWALGRKLAIESNNQNMKNLFE